MAIPRVFVSSTFYDLQHVRNDIHSFLKGLGYDPVMNDKGTLTYSQDEPLEESCYSEVDSCDIVVCIIGGHYGTSSETRPGKSITMNEIETALRKNKLVYIYILKNVYSEYLTYKANEASGTFKPYHADDIRVLKYISDLETKVRTRPITQFEMAQDIVSNLRQQFAGKFQQLLQRQSNPMESKTIESLDEIIGEMKEYVQLASSNLDDITGKIRGSIFAPLQPIKVLMEKLSLKKFKVFVDSRDSLDEFMTALGYSLDELERVINNTTVYEKITDKLKVRITISEELFEGDRIKDVRDKDLLNKSIVIESSTVDEDIMPF